MDIEKVQAVDEYLRKAVPTRDVRTTEKGAFGVDFAFRHDITGTEHVVRFTGPFFNGRRAEEIPGLLGSWKLSERIEASGGALLVVDAEGVKAGDE